MKTVVSRRHFLQQTTLAGLALTAAASASLGAETSLPPAADVAALRGVVAAFGLDADEEDGVAAAGDDLAQAGLARSQHLLGAHIRRQPQTGICRVRVRRDVHSLFR